MKATTKQKGNVSSMQSEIMDKVGLSGEDKIVEETPKVENKKKEITGMQELVFGEGEEKKFLAKVVPEYTFATRGLDGWIDKNLRRLKLYNNQKRSEDTVGEPMIFTHMNTWLSSLYEDEFDKEFAPREAGDIKTAENLTNLAEYDSELMGKAELDYHLDWDALFFSYGLFDMVEFDVSKKCPAPSIIDPLGFYYDTLSSSIDGNIVNKGGMRFLGWSMYMSQREIENSDFINGDAIKKLKEVDANGNTKKDQAREQRMEAMGGDTAQFESTVMEDNNVFEVLQWRTWWKGQKVLVILSPDCKSYLGGKILPLDEDGNSMSWFVGAKRFNPQPHQFKGMSIPDEMEDKQRMKAILLNDQINLARVSVYGSNAYDTNKITNVADLKFGFDKWIPTDGDPRNAIAPVYKDNGNANLIEGLLSYLDTSAQMASATPSLQQGVVGEQQRTLGELQIVQQSSRTRYSLALKTFAMGDKDFYSLYYMSLKVNLKDGLGKKMIRINGSSGSFRELSRDEVICKIDPDVRITSRTLSEATKQRKFVQFSKMLELIMLDPQADKRAGEKYGLHLSMLSQDEIDDILPPTSDEVIAREQNEMIGMGKIPPFAENENHRVHLSIHREALEGKIKANHIKLHKEALKIQQANPNTAPVADPNGMEQGQTAPAQAQRSTMPVNMSQANNLSTAM